MFTWIAGYAPKRAQNIAEIEQIHPISLKLIDSWFFKSL